MRALLACILLAQIGRARSLEEWIHDEFLGNRSRLVSKVGDDGAVSVNRGWKPGSDEPFFIEQQRYGADLIHAGLMTEQEALIQEGVRILEWGFQRQGSEGDFPGTGDPMHSTSFFVEAASRAALLLQASGREDLKDVSASWVPKILAAARWMARPEEIQRRPHLDLEPYTHRYYLRAAALLQASSLTGDVRLETVGLRYLKQGLRLQRPNGINPEKGGLDVSYQGVGVFYAQRLLPYLRDPSLKKQVQDMMTLAWQPVLARVREDGRLDTSDSRRAKEVGRSGTPKRVAYRMMIPALAEQTRLTGDPRYTEAGLRMAQTVWPADHK